jgi:hypothetical protein
VAPTGASCRGATECFTFGHFESAAAHRHRSLSEALELIHSVEELLATAQHGEGEFVFLVEFVYHDDAA